MANGSSTTERSAATPARTCSARLARCSFSNYFSWLRPSIAGIALAIGVFVGFEVVVRGLANLATGSLRENLPVESYQAMIAPGTWPWWFVLHYWPAAIYAPFVEETVYRGFLWRGLAASRLGNLGAWLLTSLFFGAIHYDYYIQDGAFVPGPLIGSTVVFLVKLVVLAAGLAAAEVFIAKWRLFRVPELLAGSFLLALLSVSASFFLA